MAAGSRRSASRGATPTGPGLATAEISADRQAATHLALSILVRQIGILRVDEQVALEPDDRAEQGREEIRGSHALHHEHVVVEVAAASERSTSGTHSMTSLVELMCPSWLSIASESNVGSTAARQTRAADANASGSSA